MNFENLTVGQLRKLTEQYETIVKENKILKTKYPSKLKEENSAEKLLEELNIKWNNIYDTLQ